MWGCILLSHVPARDVTVSRGVVDYYSAGARAEASPVRRGTERALSVLARASGVE